MIPTTRLKRLYRYEETYNKIYIICFDNRKIIRVRDIRFYKRNIPDKENKREVLFKVVFNNEIEKLTFKKVRFKTIFGSSKLLISRILKTL